MGCYEGPAIYQTSGLAQLPMSPAYHEVVGGRHSRALSGGVSGGLVGAMGALALDPSSSRNLLPSFLHDIVESPSLSPTTSSSSAGFSWEEYGELASSGGTSSGIVSQHSVSSHRDAQSQGQVQGQVQGRQFQGQRGREQIHDGEKVLNGSTSSFALARDSIWKMDGLELMSTTAMELAPHAPDGHATSR